MLSSIFDQENRLVVTIRPDGSTTQTTYNGIDKAVAEIDPLGRVTSHEYDGQGSLTRTGYPDLTFEMFG